MKRICSGCGSEIPEGSDFCYACGAWATNSFAINDEGTVLYSNKCVKCGNALIPGSKYCAYCGAQASESNIPIRRSSGAYSSKDIMAIMLAVIPGLFNVFGLGQIILRRWSKAFVYICSTLMLFYITPSLISSTNGYLILIFIQVFFFFISVWDVFRSISLGRV